METELTCDETESGGALRQWPVAVGSIHPQGVYIYEGSDVDMELLFMEMQDPQTNRSASKLLKYHHPLPRRSLISFKDSAQCHQDAI